MSVIYPVAIIDARLQLVIDAIDAGVGNGLLKIGTAGMGVVLSTVTLLKPCATISAGVLTFSGTPLVDGSAAFTGTPEAAIVTDSSGAVVISGLVVGETSGDIIITEPTIDAGDIVTFLAGTITGN